MRRSLVLAAFLGVCVATLGYTLAQDTPKQPHDVVKDPLDKLLDDFADACAQNDIKKAENLFLRCVMRPTLILMEHVGYVV